MFSAIKKFFGAPSATTDGAASTPPGSKEVARSRLQFVLVQDRTGLSSDEMASFKREMVGVIEKYFVVDPSAFDITYKRDQESTTLLINSPVVVKRKKGERAKIETSRSATESKTEASATGSASSESTPASPNS